MLSSWAFDDLSFRIISCNKLCNKLHNKGKSSIQRSMEILK